MDELDVPLVEDLFFMFIAEGGQVLACPLNVPLFGMSERDLIDGAKLANPARYYKEVAMAADMNLTF
jgi:predicted peroxiredoxin